MDNLKWCEIYLEDSECYRKNIEKLNTYVDKYNLSVVSKVIKNKNEFQEILSEAKSNYTAVRVDSPLTNLLFKSLSVTGSDVYRLQACDALIKKNENWRPLSCLRTGVEKILSMSNENFDLGKKALVTGDGYLSVCAIAVLLQMGLRYICLANTSAEKSEKLRDIILKFNHSAQVEIIDPKKFSLLKDEFNIFINTIKPNAETNSFVEDICYFNFLTSKGYVWDLQNSYNESEFCKQSKELGYGAVGAEEVTAFTDQYWVHSAFGIDIGFEDYLSALKS